jgi:signal transduction histidine kinase/ligand-binding sensor domain-containing protein/CheY-like chemotaxis protein
MILLFQFLFAICRRVVIKSIGKIGLALMFLMSTQWLSSQDKQYLFTNTDISGGLSHNHVQCFLKDRMGFLWAGTFEGLNRFDGYSFKIFKNTPGDSTSLKDNLITRLFEDPKGKIWIASGQYLQVYDPEKETFVRRESLFDGRIPVPVGSTWQAAYDVRGDLIYANSVSGIYKYVVASDTVLKINTAHPYSDSTITWMEPDPSGNIWVSFMNSHIYRIDGQNFAFTDSVKLPAGPNNRLGFYIDDDNDLWIYNLTISAGVFFYDSRTHSVENFSTGSSRCRLNNNTITGIVQDNEGNIWIGTDHGGINIIRKKDFSVRYLVNDPYNPRSIPDNTIVSLYKDYQGFIWLGSFKNGMAYYHKDLFVFDYYKIQLENSKLQDNNDIDNFVEDRNGNVWIGTNGGGLIYFDRKNNTYRQYVNDPADPSSISANIIIGLYYDNRDRLWVGTYFGGLDQWDGKKFTHFKNNPSDPASLSDDRVWDICEDNDGMLWIATLLGGVNVFDPVKKRVIACYRSANDTTLRSNSVFSVIQGKNNTMWFATVDGLRSYNRTTGKFTYYNHDDKDPRSLSKNYVLDVFEDSRGFIWAATNDGLNRLDPATGKFDIFRMEQGLPGNLIVSITEDNDHNLWMSTSSGLSKLTLSQVKDSSQFVFKNFDVFDGLQSNEFNEKAIMKTRGGELFFGGPNGFNIIDPKNIIAHNIQSDIVFTDFLIFNKSVDIKKTSEGISLLEKAMPYTREIRLKHNENVFTIEFSNLNFNHPERRKYMYRMDNFKDEWYIVDSRERRVTYTNLNAGKYLFRVRSTNNDGTWNEKEAQLSIIVRPPWWNTLLIKMLGILFLASVIIGYYYFRLRRLNRQKKQLEKKVNERTLEIYEANTQLEEQQREVMVQNLELEKHQNNLEQLVLGRTVELEEALMKAKESDRLKSAFLANMSHEIRTPMNAIVGFSSLLDDKDITPKERKEFIELIHANSESLLMLINDILDLSLIEGNQLVVRSEPFRLNDMVDQIVSYFKMRNRNSGFEFRVNHSLLEEDLVLLSDKFRLKQILSNFISNACKFTTSGIVEFGSARNNNRLQLYVRDTGIGISKENIPYLFERFRKLGEESTATVRGAGLGLAISKRLADLLGGAIEVQSEPGKGSVFIFSIPFDLVATQTRIKKEPDKKAIGKNWADKKILIVEDEEANYLYLRRILEKTHADITWAENGMEAVKYVESGSQFDLILMDIKMPVMGGTEALKQLKGRNPGQRIIAQTAYARAEDEIAFRQQGFDDYISKPINRKELFEILEKYL